MRDDPLRWYTAIAFWTWPLFVLLALYGLFT